VDYAEVDDINFRQRIEQPRQHGIRIGERLFSELELMIRALAVAIPWVDLSCSPCDLQAMSCPDQSQAISPYFAPVVKR
jgi:hypothetical protein